MTATAETARIPVLDVAPFLAGAPGAAADLAAAVARTSADTGFLVISGHGVPQPVIEAGFAAAARFFAEPEPVKLALKIGAENIGYLPYGGQTVRTSTVSKVTRPNNSESFYVVTPDAAEDRNRWPGTPGFRDDVSAYFTTMRALAHKLLPAFALALDLAPDWFEADFQDPNGIVRLIQYAPQPEQDDDLFGFAPHTDGSFITLLPQSKYPGLEVRTHEGAWIRPAAVPGTLVVNTGELLAHYSNDRFKPTPHRVLNRGREYRHAMPFFYGPNRHRVVDCVPTCVGADNPPRYKPMTSFERNAIKDRTNFPHRQQPEFASERY